MSPELLDAIFFSAVRAATPLLLAGLGILLLEKSGVLNLGQEGVVAVSAVVSFLTQFYTGSWLWALVAAVISALLLNTLFALLVFRFRAGQVISGLSLSLFGVGLAALLASIELGAAATPLPALPIPLLQHVPLLGAALFSQDGFVYVAALSVALIWWLLYRTRWGLHVRAVGDAPSSAYALGYHPNRIRFQALMLCAVCVGLAGAYLSMVYTPVLAEGMSGGRGWIALALVVFAGRQLRYLVLGALLFGFFAVVNLVLGDLGWRMPGSIAAMMPYVLTIVVLLILSALRVSRSEPASLGQNFNVSNR